MSLLIITVTFFAVNSFCIWLGMQLEHWWPRKPRSKK